MKFDPERPFASPDAGPRKSPQQVWVQSATFLGEQDGPPERELQERLSVLFDTLRMVRIAYLARVQYGDTDLTHVALCVQGVPGQSHMFAERVGRIFASIFGNHEHLDTIWLQPDQQTALAKVCRPFYECPIL